MADRSVTDEHITEVDTALLDAELFLKYKAPDRAIKRLRTALERNARSIPLRERIREVCISHKQSEEAARQCLALASLYVERDDFENAYERLLEAKQLDPRLNIAAGLEAIRRARRPDLGPQAGVATPPAGAHGATLTGDLAAINAFDVIQVIENARLTGTLLLANETQNGRVSFNDGRIVDAECNSEVAESGFRRIVEITSGRFEFQKSTQGFPIRIQAASNTNLILDTLRQLDEDKR